MGLKLQIIFVGSEQALRNLQMTFEFELTLSQRPYNQTVEQQHSLSHSVFGEFSWTSKQRGNPPADVKAID